MAVPSQATQTAGAILTASYLNDDVRDAVNFLTNPPACRVRGSADWMNWAATATLYATTWNTEDYDTDTMHSTGANTSYITFTTAGVYTLKFKLHVKAPGAAWANNSRINTEWRIVGGATIDTMVFNPQDANIVTGHTHSIDYKFTAGQSVELWAGWEVAGPPGALNPALSSGVDKSFVSALWIGTGA